MYNLLPAALHPAARVLQGQKAWSMVEGAGPGRRRSTSRCSSAITPGPAIRAGRSPTPTPARPVETRLDGRPTGEYGLNALVLGAWGDPGRPGRGRRRAGRGGRRLAAVGRAGRGQDGGRRQRGGLGPPDRGRATGSGPVRSARSGAAAAGALELLRVGPPVVIEVDYAAGVEADHAAIVPGAERVGDRGVRFASDDPAIAVPRLPGRQPAGASRSCRSRDAAAGRTARSSAAVAAEPSTLRRA